jgi:hypothetical protein
MLCSMETKRCNTHNNGEGAELPVSAFSKAPKLKSGYRSNCKQCGSEAATKWREKSGNYEKALANSRKWYAGNYDKIRARHKEYGKNMRDTWKAEDLEGYRRYKSDVHLKHKFGIGVDQYESMLAMQDGKCGICGVPASKHRRLPVDHCHATKAVRGLLCVSCNAALERVETIAGWTEKAKAYLAKFQDVPDPAG